MNSPKPAPTHAVAAPTARPEVPLIGYTVILGGTFFWALTGVFVKIMLTRYGMEPLVLAFWRVFFVTAGLLLILLSAKGRDFRIAPRDILIFLVYGLVGVAIHQILWITSVQYNGVAVATVLVYTSPALVALFAWRFMRETINRNKVFALVLTIAGCALVARVYDLGQIQLNPIGLMSGIGCAFTMGAYSLFGRAVTRRYSAWTSLFYAFLFGGLFLAPFGLLMATPVVPALPLDGWGNLLFLALVPTLGGFAAYTVGLANLPASVASILASLEPAIAATIAYFVFGEVLDVPQVFGGALILAGVILLRPRNT